MWVFTGIFMFITIFKKSLNYLYVSKIMKKIIFGKYSMMSTSRKLVNGKVCDIEG